MAGNILIDTGPIVALIDQREHYHNWCKQQSGALSYPFYTCESVLSESFHILEATPQGTETLVGMLEKELIRCRFSYSEHAGRVRQIMQTYHDLPASFADACLVCMAQNAAGARIFTLDGHFNVYRDPGGNPLSVIAPRR